MSFKGWAVFGATGAVSTVVHVKRHYANDPVGSRTCQICRSFEEVQKRLPLPKYDVEFTIELIALQGVGELEGQTVKDTSVQRDPQVFGTGGPMCFVTTLKAPTRRMAGACAKAWLLGVLPDVLSQSGARQSQIGRITFDTWRV